jgi:hypothetical protein
MNMNGPTCPEGVAATVEQIMLLHNRRTFL